MQKSSSFVPCLLALGRVEYTHMMLTTKKEHQRITHKGCKELIGVQEKI
ncbi:MAG: hypothetical protein ACLRTR_03875 [Clostridia bacterium]